MVQKMKMKSFDEYEVEPSPVVWERIREKLPPPRNKKRGWLLWMAAASVTGLCFLAGYFLEVDIRWKQHAASPAPSASESAGTPVAGKDPDGALTVKQSADAGMTGSQVKSEKNPIASGSSYRRTTLSREGTGTASASVTASAANSATRSYPEAGNALQVSSAQEGAPIARLEGIDFTPRDPMLPQQLEQTGSEWQLRPRKTVSRWQFALLGSADYCYRTVDISSETTPLVAAKNDEMEAHESGIQAFSTSALASYNLNPHFSIQSGITYFVSGQERDHSEVSLYSGIPGGSMVYSVGTSAGPVTGNGQQFDLAYFNNTDSSLFNHSAAAAPDNTSASFVLEQQFHFVSVPFLAQYQPAERKLTPYVGLGFSVGYLVEDKIYLNDMELDYSYSENLQHVLFSAEAQAGVKYNLWKQVAFRLQPTFRYGLHSLSSHSQVRWIPYSFGLGFGISYRY